MADKKRNGKANKTIIIALITLVLIFSGFAFYLITNKNRKTLPETAETTLNIQITPMEETFSDDWETYINNEYKYQLKYHKKWHKQGDNEPPYPPPPAGMSFSRRGPDPVESCDFAILSSSDSKAYQGEIQSLRDERDYQEIADTLAGVPAIRFISDKNGYYNTSYYLENNGFSYRVGYNYNLTGVNGQECKDVFEKMISSFSFL